MRKTILGSAMLSIMVLGFVCAFVLVANINPTEIITTMGAKGWRTIASAQEGGGSLGASAGGVLQVYVYPHSADPGTDYASNLSNASAYAWANTLNSAMTGNVPYDTTFDIVYKIRVNVSEAYNSTGSSWETSWVRSNITCADLSIGADTAMTGVEIDSDDTWMWMNFYINNGGSGYTISHGEHVNITSYKLQCWM